MIDLALKFVIIESIIFLVYSLIFRRFNTSQLIYIFVPLLFVLTLPFFIPQFNIDNAVETFEGFENSWETVYSITQKVSLAWASFLTILNAIGVVLTGGTYIVKLYLFYASLLVGKFYDPLSAILYTLLLSSQSLYAIFHTLHQLAIISKILIPIVIGVALPLIAWSRTRILGASLLTIGLVLYFTTFIAYNYVTGHTSELNAFYKNALNITSTLNSTNLKINGSQVLIVQGEPLWFVDGSLITGNDAVHFMTFTPSTPILVPNTTNVKISETIYYWLSIPINSKVSINDTHIIIALPEPPFERIVYGNAVIGVWKFLSSPDSYTTSQSGNVVYVRFRVNLPSAKEVCRKVGNKTKCKIIPSTRSVRIWSFVKSINAKYTLPSGVEVKEYHSYGKLYGEVDLHSEFNTTYNYMLNLIKYYSPTLMRFYNVNVSKSNISKPPISYPSTSKQQILSITFKNYNTYSVTVSGFIKIRGGDAWHSFGVTDQVIPYLSIIDEYLSSYGSNVTSWFSLYDSLLLATSPFGTFIPLLMVEFIVILGLLAGLGHALGIPNVFSMFGMRVWRFIMYDLSLIFYLRVMTRLPGRVLSRLFRTYGLKLLSWLVGRRVVGKLSHPLYRIVSISSIITHKLSTRHAMQEVLSSLKQYKATKPIARLVEKYHQYQLAGIRGQVPILKFKQDMAEIIDSRVVYEFPYGRRITFAKTIDMFIEKPSLVRRTYLKQILTGNVDRDIEKYVRKSIITSKVQELRSTFKQHYVTIMKVLLNELNNIDKGNVPALMMSKKSVKLIQQAIKLKKYRDAMKIAFYDILNNLWIKGKKKLKATYHHYSTLSTFKMVRPKYLNIAIKSRFEEISRPFMEKFYKSIEPLRSLYDLEGIPTTRVLAKYTNEIFKTFNYKVSKELIYALSSMIREYRTKQISLIGEYREFLRNYFKIIIPELIKTSRLDVVSESRRVINELTNLKYYQLKNKPLSKYFKSKGYSDKAINYLMHDKILRELISYKVLTTTRTNIIDLALTFRMPPPASIIQFMNKERLVKVVEDMYCKGEIGIAEFRRLASSFKILDVKFSNEFLNRIVKSSSPSEKYAQFVYDVFNSCRMVMSSEFKTLMRRSQVRDRKLKIIDLVRASIDAAYMFNRLAYSEKLRIIAHDLYRFIKGKRHFHTNNTVKDKIRQRIEKHVQSEVLIKILNKYLNDVKIEIEKILNKEIDVNRLDELRSRVENMDLKTREKVEELIREIEIVLNLKKLL